MKIASKINIVLLLILSLFLAISCSPKENVQILQVLIWKGNLDVAPADPEKGWAYYNSKDGISYVYTGSSWEVIARDGIGIVWKGELDTPPVNPVKNWAYFNRVDGNSYIYSGNDWEYLAKSGADGASGILKWLGELSDFPQNPLEGDAFYNLTDGVSYIYDNEEWSILAKDGIDSTFNWLGAVSETPVLPERGDAYYNTTDNTSYIFNGYSWDILVANSDVYYNIPVSWQGELPEAPSSPSFGWAYYNIVIGASYIWDGTTWQKIAQDGYSPEGFLIQWQGSLLRPPVSPEKGWAYYDISDNSAYIFDGTSWTLFVMGSSGGSSGHGELEVSIDGIVVDPATYFHMGEYGKDGIWKPLRKTVVVRNIGSNTVSFYRNGPVISAGSSNTVDYFLDASDFKNTLKPGESTSLDVIFSPSYGTTYHALYSSTLHLFSDSLFGDYYFYLTADSLLPAFYVSYGSMTVYLMSGIGGTMYDSIDFGDVSSDTNVSLSVIEAAHVPENYTISIEGEDADCFVISNNVSSLLTIELASNDLGEKNAEIVISNSDFRYTVPIHADFQTISDPDKPEEPDPGEFVYGKFNSAGEIFFDGGEGDGNDSCHYVLSDGHGGLYLIGEAYEKVNYASSYDTWIIHLDENDEIVDEWLFDERLFSNVYYSVATGRLLSDERIALITGSYNILVIIDLNSGVTEYTNVYVSDVISMDDDGFWTLYANNIYRYDYSGHEIRRISISSSDLTVSDVLFVQDGLIAVGGHVSNHEALNSGEDAALFLFDVSSDEPVMVHSWYFDAGHGDADSVSSMILFDDKLIVSGTSEDLISSRSEIDGWITAFDPETLERDMSVSIVNDSSYPDFFSYDGNLYVGTNNSMWRFDYPDMESYTVFSYSFPYYQETADIIIIDDYLYIPGYASEYQTKQENGNDWVVKRFSFE